MGQNRKILITGANGFIAKNLIWELRNRGYNNLYLFDRGTDISMLDIYCKECDFVFHLAGVNRPKEEKEFSEGNADFTLRLTESLKRNQNQASVLMTSSIQAQQDNPYGKSKKKGEDILFSYEKQSGINVYIYRLPNVFGKWCRPNYNSVVATFCYNIATNQPIKIHDSSKEMYLVYIDDVINELIRAMQGKTNRNKGNLYCDVQPVYTVQLGQIAELLTRFKESRETLQIPDLSEPFIKKLYSTYLSYIPIDKLKYSIKQNTDHRGSFTEMLKSVSSGQFSINISKPGILRGQHWHHTKCEKFLVVSGKGVIRFRDINTEEIVEYFVSDEEFEVIDVVPGLTHNIESLGDKDMITVMWANEIYDQQNADTYYFEVESVKAASEMRAQEKSP